MVNIVEDMLNKYSDVELIEYLDRHARELLKGYKVVLDGNRDANQLIALYGKVDMIADVLSHMRKRNQERQAQRNML